MREKNNEFDDEVRQKLEAAGIAVSQCRDCGEDIIFLKTKKDKWMPLDMNLEPHWQGCPAADKFRRRQNG